MNQRFKNQGGITLIALIITIIILVILAAVSIRAVYNMGIVGHAINGTQDYVRAAKAENEMLDTTIANLEQDLAKLKEIQGSSGGAGGTTTKLTTAEQTALAANGMAELTGNQITNNNLKNNPNIKAVLTGEVPLPTNYTYVEGTSTTESTLPTGGSWGVVIKDGSNNEFVWVPVNATESIAPSGVYETISATNIGNIDNNKGLEIAYTGDLSGLKLATINRGILLASSSSSLEESASNTKVSKRTKQILSGSDYTRTTPDDTSGYREPALVTDYDLDESNKYYTQAGFTSAKAMADAFVTDYEAMIASIEKYGGFYVGRYELSGTNNGESSEIGSPKVQANQTPIDYVNWYRLYEASRKFNTSSTTSTMIWGSQWDIVCLWSQKSGDQVSYSNSDSSRHSNDSDAKTGTNTADKRNNIYDLEGSRYEWTQEANDTYDRASRGGSYSDGYSASDRGGIRPFNGLSSNSSRPTLYIR